MDNNTETAKDKVADRMIGRIEDVEINLVYMMAMAIERIIDDIDRRFRAKGARFSHDKKMRFNNIIKACKEVKRQSDLIDQTDYKDAFKGREGKWMDYYENGLWIARLMLLVCDRITANPDAYYGIPKHLRTRKTAGIVTEKDLERFYTQKFNG